MRVPRGTEEQGTMNLFGGFCKRQTVEKLSALPPERIEWIAFAAGRRMGIILQPYNFYLLQ